MLTSLSLILTVILHPDSPIVLSITLFFQKTRPPSTQLARLKNQIAVFVSIPPDDQIILIGPPYKRLDPFVHGGNLNTDGQRIFLYDRRVFKDELRQPLDNRIPPFTLPPPLPNDSSTSLPPPPTELSKLLECSPSPLFRLLADYERGFMKNLKRGEALLAFSQECLASCRKCADEQLVQTDAVVAAWNNLQDHYVHTKMKFETLEEKCLLQKRKYQLLLESFPSDLEKLGSVYLHPSLASEISQGMSQQGGLSGNNSVNSSSNLGSGGVGGGGSRLKLTLLDCVPVNEEKEWHRKCVANYQRVEEFLQRIRMEFEEVSKGFAAVGVAIGINASNEGGSVNVNVNVNVNDGDANRKKLLSALERSEKDVTLQEHAMNSLRQDYR